MLVFTTSGRLQALAVVLCLSACSEEVAMSGTEVAAANKAAVLRLFDEVLNGGQDQVLPESVVVPAMSMNRMAGGKIAESWVQSGPPQPQGGS